MIYKLLILYGMNLSSDRSDISVAHSASCGLKYERDFLSCFSSNIIRRCHVLYLDIMSPLQGLEILSVFIPIAHAMGY